MIWVIRIAVVAACLVSCLLGFKLGYSKGKEDVCIWIQCFKDVCQEYHVESLDSLCDIFIDGINNYMN